MTATTDLVPIIRSLMFSENMGDVHEVIDRLCKMAGIPVPEGDFLDGWTDQDLRNVNAANE